MAEEHSGFVLLGDIDGSTNSKDISAENLNVDTKVDIAPASGGGILEVRNQTANQAASGKIIWGESNIDAFELQYDGSNDDLTLFSNTKSDIMVVSRSAGGVTWGYNNTVSGNLHITGTSRLVGNVLTNAQLDVEGYSTFGNGSALLSRFTMRIDRDFSASATAAGQLQLRGILTATGGTGQLYGASFNPSGTVINSGNAHSVVSSVIIDEPTITLTSGTATIASSLYIQRAPTEGGDNYALCVDSGLSRFDGDGTDVFELPADATDPTGGGGAATGRIPVKIGGATVYIPYY